MRGKLIKLSETKSKDGGYCWLLCFKMEDGKSARTWLYPSNGNFRRWGPHIMDFQAELKAGREVMLEDLMFRGDASRRLIDADSQFQISKQPATA